MATNFIFPELGSALLLTGGGGWMEGLEKLGASGRVFIFHAALMYVRVWEGRTVGGTASGV